MKKIDFSTVPLQTGSNYPAPFNLACNDQSTQPLGRHAGLTVFGVKLTVIGPGAWSSQRHWHSHEDEFIWVVQGELTLVTNAGEEMLSAGDCAAFRRGDPDGHHLINKSGRPAKVLEIGNSDPLDLCVYSDIDLTVEPGVAGYSHKNGMPYAPQR
jgi:uncharacterized cupin superfamily protein